MSVNNIKIFFLKSYWLSAVRMTVAWFYIAEIKAFALKTSTSWETKAWGEGKEEEKNKKQKEECCEKSLNRREREKENEKDFAQLHMRRESRQRLPRFIFCIFDCLPPRRVLWKARVIWIASSNDMLWLGIF